MEGNAGSGVERLEVEVKQFPRVGGGGRSQGQESQRRESRERGRERERGDSEATSKVPSTQYLKSSVFLPTLSGSRDGNSQF
jgi:hypothetical protein